MEKTFVRRKPIKCPNCGFRPVANYQYGFPYFNDELERDLENKKIVLGGCCISEDNPLWHCTNCKTDFYLQVESLEEFLLKYKEKLK